jgi:hypothetical protein
MGLLDDIRGAAGDFISNVLDPGGIGREVAKRSAQTIAGVFNDVTSPFLGPLDNIMNVLWPKIRFGDINANLTLAGGTTHSFVLPQLPSLPGAGGAGDVTGGLLSDLAFDSEALRRAETDLKFLSSALRRGVYPHRADAFFLGVSAVPKVTASAFAGDFWLRVIVKDVESGASEADFTFGLRAMDINEQLETLRARMGEKSPSRELAAALERSRVVQVRAERGKRRRLSVEITVHNFNGEEIKNFNFLRELSIWIERRNDGYTDVLHQFVWYEPGEDKVKLVFPIERIESISDNEDNKMEALGRAGGRLANVADALDRALETINTPAAAPPAGDPNGTDLLGQILARRVHRAETVREHLWTARRQLVRLRSGENVFDYRLRFKLRIENANAARRTITRLRVRSTGVPNADFELLQFELPRQSRYDITVYPLRQDPNTRNEASLEMGEAKTNFTMALVAGLGVAETVVLSSFPKPTATATPVDTGLLTWVIDDTAE